MGDQAPLPGRHGGLPWLLRRGAGVHGLRDLSHFLHLRRQGWHHARLHLREAGGLVRQRVGILLPRGRPHQAHGEGGWSLSSSGTHRGLGGKARFSRPIADSAVLLLPALLLLCLLLLLLLCLLVLRALCD